MYSANTPKAQENLPQAAPDKPPTLAVKLADIPVELCVVRRWVLWRWELRRDARGKLKWSKVPYSAKLGEADEHWNRARSNDPTTWTSLQEVLQRSRYFDGIGFMLGDGFSGIDLDRCRDPESGHIGEKEQEIVRDINSYTEVSPRNGGVKILVKARKPDGRCRIGNIEMYSTGRFFAITGHHLDGTPTTVEERQEEVNRLHARLFPGPAHTPSPNGKPHTRPSAAWEDDEDHVTDAEILATAQRAKNGEKFARLWAGDWQALGYPSQSEADEALTRMLAFWTGPNPGRIDRLFRRSALYRDKWDRADYRARTVERVLDGEPQFYAWVDAELHDLEAKALEIVQAVDVPGRSAKVVGVRQDSEWPEPLKLERRTGADVPAFPIEVVREIVPAYHDIYRSIAEVVQVPLDVPALMGLSVMSIPLAGRVRIAIRPDKYEPAILWTLCALPAGERKTPAVNPMRQPIVEWEKEERRRMAEDVRCRQAQRKCAAQRKQRLDGLFKTAKEEDLAGLTRQYAQLELEFAQPEPELPRLLVDDATCESLAPFLHKHEGKAACLSDEAVFLEVALGRYNGSPNFELYLRGWDGGDYRVDRVGREPIYLPEVTLTLGLCIQVQPFLELARNEVAEARGLFPRFLVATPRSMMGHRRFVLDGGVAQAAWNELVFRMLRDRRPRALEHSEEGYRVIKEFVEKYEPKLADNRELVSLRSWCGKAIPGQMLRVAAVLHCASGDPATVVKADTLRAAIVLIEYFLAHVKQVSNVKEEDMALDMARKIRDYITRNGMDRFTWGGFRRHIKAVRNADDSTLDEAYAILQACHVIREAGRTGQTVHYTVNPRVLG
jgi:hypothetical protein